MFLALDKDMNGTLSKQELKEYAEGSLTEIFIERGKGSYWSTWIADHILEIHMKCFIFSKVSIILNQQYLKCTCFIISF